MCQYRFIKGLGVRGWSSGSEFFKTLNPKPQPLIPYFNVVGVADQSFLKP